MTRDLTIALQLILPGAQYGGSLTDNTREAYEALTWEDNRPKPSWAEIDAAHVKLVPAFYIKQRLKDLDGVYSRTYEDRDASIGFTPFHTSPQAQAKAEKEQLRAELAELESK